MTFRKRKPHIGLNRAQHYRSYSNSVSVINFYRHCKYGMEEDINIWMGLTTTIYKKNNSLKSVWKEKKIPNQCYEKDKNCQKHYLTPFTLCHIFLDIILDSSYNKLFKLFSLISGAL